MPLIDAVSEATSLLEQWEKDNTTSVSPKATLEKLAALVEREIEAWYKMDPDPFDDRHPGRSDPNCSLGHVLKAIIKNETFMNKLGNTYLVNREHHDLHTVSARLLLNVMPGLETSVVFSDFEPLLRRLAEWAEGNNEPLSSYAVGLLAGAMEVQDIVIKFKDFNSKIVPILLKRLHTLKQKQISQAEAKESQQVEKINLKRPFANIGKEGEESNSQTESTKPSPSKTPEAKVPKLSPQLNRDTPKTPSKLRCNKDEDLDPKSKIPAFESSNSSWADQQQYVIAKYQLWPLSVEMQQRLILQYLTPMGEYQEMLSLVLEHNALDLIFYYIDLKRNKDVRLAFEALRYLAALLCHKKFAVAFIQSGGVQRLLAVPRPSVASTGVSMCLYYLAYFEDIMERVCLLPQKVLAELVSCELWMLECSHESGRCHATMFFGMAFPFRVILELFDQQDGLRKIYNVISTLAILNVEEDTEAILTEDEVFASRQAARHVCVALMKYFQAHLAIKADQLRRSHMRNESASPLQEMPAYKATTFPPEVIEDSIELLLECLPYRIKWGPVHQFLELGGITLLLQLVAMAAEWSAYIGKGETIRSALDALRVCTVMPSCQMHLSESVLLPDNVSTPAVSILLGLAESELISDPDIQKAALHIINNCVCGPLSRLTGGVGRIVGGSTRRKMSVRNGEDLLMKMWSCVRSNNGIMVLLKLLYVKTPITEADCIRGLACKALVGLARSTTVRQIVSKLPLVNDGRLQMLMKEPILQDKRQEHVKFCKFAQDLLEMVSGKPRTAAQGATLDRIRKADVVAQTRIRYQQKELLQLIQSHLLSIGMEKSAMVLQREADLPRPPSPPSHALPSSPQLFATPNSASTPRMSRQLNSSIVPHPSPSPTTSYLATPGTPLGPIRVNIISSKTQSTASRIQQSKRIICQKRQASSIVDHSPVLSRVEDNQTLPKGTRTNVSLDKIVTEYLREQHASCKAPVVTCPLFSLFSPHRCPEPRKRQSAPVNITMRTHKRSLYPRFGGPDGLQCDRKFIYSRFRPTRSIRDTEQDGCFSCCTFAADEQHILLGTYAGEVKAFNINSGAEVSSSSCSNSPINHVQTTRDGTLLITSATWGRPMSSLWQMHEVYNMKHGFSDDTYMEFSRQVQDRIIGTQDETAVIYDVATGQSIVKLYDQHKANHYTRNKATFNPTDDLVLNDGVLWDVNSGKAVHKFDKFNANVSGVFHPSGLEAIINMEVWDLRTFHLLHTVPALDQCQIRFNHSGDIIYGAIHQWDEEEDAQDMTMKSPFGSSFRTFDARDYTNIATIDVKKNIFDLCADSTDDYLAVVENARSEETLGEESICHLYQVGRKKDSEDQAEDEEEEEEEEDDDDDDDDLDIDDGSNSTAAADEEDNRNDRSSNEGGDSDGPLFDDSDMSSVDGDSEDNDDDDMDDFYFELSDLSNMG